MRQKKIKVVFILPEKAKETATHVMHKWEMLGGLEHEVEFLVYAPHGFDVVKILAAPFWGARVFYVHYSFKGAALALATRLYSGSKVFYWNCGLPWLYKRNVFEERVFRFILRHTIFVTGTPGLARTYAHKYGLDEARIRVIPNYIRIDRMRGIDKKKAREQLGIPFDKKVVLFLHRLSRRKGAHLLPEIIKEFTNRDDLLFLIVGDGPEKKNIESGIVNYKLWNMVRMEGDVKNTIIPQYFAAADVYVMPSEEEGMPNALLEAMAAGVPFVASSVGGVKEMTPPDLHTYVLPYGHTASFAACIQKLLNDEELRKSISRREQEWVDQYDVDVIKSHLLALFRP